ncbi:MAG: hypothetical protein ACT443_10430 [Gemmatimonadota bacterium]
MPNSTAAPDVITGSSQANGRLASAAMKPTFSGTIGRCTAST